MNNAILTNDAKKMHNTSSFYKHILLKIASIKENSSIKETLDSKYIHLSFLDKISILDNLDKSLKENYILKEEEFVSNIVSDYYNKNILIDTNELPLDDIKDILSTLIIDYFIDKYDDSILSLIEHFNFKLTRRIDSIKKITITDKEPETPPYLEETLNNTLKYRRRFNIYKEKLIIFYNRTKIEKEYLTSYKHLFKVLSKLDKETMLRVAFDFDFNSPSEIDEVASLYEKTISKMKS